ncbi:hypothetical protein CO024_00215 [Candidatus Gracilibacteria bacterium CG_4_9_14_0_2_um_filter_38_7]|nr:MAG: hypothetical protein AUJ87_04180 [Candidatus Gracilibacteria bacterium CG1_02_38_174]PIQ12306.1 MAG: hypothetical protein COW68_00425 [Candidatus Gracilibacteria bacterium CG18_big_fil_WC_8_21_14_2_50_38_16]PIQ42222.1 MAG: hypothetical protein COW06_00550 [Candidatus Gracilibacteria bacterium CG12_big_fil_rev_8_21_14_0_65_38_15]PJC57004.1 MAG: hypothetical protein CO024_00215 [Candidatus Gracilibacteria bacterium CG_4_9_14_0_2_um_filter_38_7]
MTSPTITSIYSSIRQKVPHTEFLPDRLVFHIQKALERNKFFGERATLLRNGRNYSISEEIPHQILDEGIGDFLESELQVERTRFTMDRIISL